MKTRFSSNRNVQLAFGSAILPFLIVGAISYRAMVVFIESDRWVRHTYEILEHLQDLRSAIAAIELNGRGFAITGDQQHLNDFQLNKLRVQQELAIVGELTADNAAQQRQIPNLERLAAQEIRIVGAITGPRRTKGFESAADPTGIGKSQRVKDEFQRVVREMVDEEQRLLLLREADSMRRIRQVKTSLILVCLLGLSIAGAAGWKIQRDSYNLARSNVELTTSNKELEAFSYSVSHDLRAPLRAIDGFSHALLEDFGDTLDDTGKIHLNRIRAASQKMGSLIDDLLNLARLSRAAMHRQTLDISALVGSITSDLQEAQPERRIDLRIEPGLQVSADPGLMRVVLENLLSNAWKFTSKRESAHVEFGMAPANGTPAYFVRDDGAGFDPAYADRLFGAFQRLHAMTEFAGTGIGLATVQRIVQRHGGRIWAESELDRGATFYFTLSGTAT